MALGDMEDDRAGLEQGEIAFLIGWNLAERMKAQMRGFLHRTERNKANLIGLAHFFKRPANARITRQSLAAIGRPFKGGNDDGHREAPGRLLESGVNALRSGVQLMRAPRPLDPLPNAGAQPRAPLPADSCGPFVGAAGVGCSSGM